MTVSSVEQDLIDFGEAYRYDTSYLIDLAGVSPAAFAVFSAAQPMSQFRESLSLEAHFVARIVAMQIDECGPCAQLNLKMAVEAGVDRALLETLLNNPDELPPLLVEVRAHTISVVAGGPQDSERSARLREDIGTEAFAELATTIVGSRIYPALKRAMLRADTCQALTLDV